jgi:uncharacterized membrane protein YciS (DUF1049 family)
MVLIGFVLLVGAAAVGIDIAAQNNVAVDVDAFGQTLSTTLAGLFVAGVVVGLAAALGMMLLRDGVVRRRRLNHEAKQAHEERDRLASAVEREQEARRIDAANSGEPIDSVDLRDHELDREHTTSF